MEHIFSAWHKVSTAIGQAPFVALLFDYDGTLVPIADRPGAALLPPGTRRLLAALSARPRFGVGVVSGRALDDLRRMVGLGGGIVLAGNHGLDIESPQRRFLHPAAAAARPALKDIAAALEESLGGVEGVVVEDKVLSLSLHFRLVPRGRVAMVRRRFQEQTRPYVEAGSIRISRGKKVYEIRPAVQWDKGYAIEWILKQCYNGVQGETLPVYTGDDATDEDGFREVSRWGGISVLVAQKLRRSLAEYYLASPAEVAELADRLLRMR